MVLESMSMLFPDASTFNWVSRGSLVVKSNQNLTMISPGLVAWGSLLGEVLVISMLHPSVASAPL